MAISTLGADLRGRLLSTAGKTAICAFLLAALWSGLLKLLATLLCLVVVGAALAYVVLFSNMHLGF